MRYSIVALAVLGLLTACGRRSKTILNKIHKRRLSKRCSRKLSA